MAQILIVEDNKAIHHMLVYIVKKMGHSLDDVYFLKDAIDHVRTKNFDFILLDLNLPDGYGADLLRVLRDELHSDTPVVILSAVQKELNIVDCLELGANDYLMKPFDPEDVRNVIQRMIPNVAL